MNIALVISNTNDPATGTAAVSWNLKREFERAGHHCEVIFKEDVLPSVRGILAQFLFAFALPFKVQLARFDVLDINAGDGLFVWLYFKLRPGRRPLLVARSHGLEHVVADMKRAEARAGKIRLSWKYPYYHGGYRLWQVRKSLKFADIALFLNAYDRDYAVQKLGLRRERTNIVDNGVPAAFLQRNISFEPPDAIKLVLIGSFSDRKGIEYSVPALNNLLLHNPLFFVEFLGPGIAASTIEAKFDHAVLPRLRIIAKFANGDLPIILADAHILLLASLAEGFPLVALEAMSCGVAMIVTDIPGIAERLEAGKHALIIPPRDQPAIESAVQALIDHPSLLKKIREGGYAVAQNFSWRRVADDTIDIYRWAITK